MDTFPIQRAIAERNGRIAIRYATSTIRINPNITRTAIKVGESSATNRAGTDVTIFSIVSLNQSASGFLRSLVICCIS
jgi:hypothetical protein